MPANHHPRTFLAGGFQRTPEAIAQRAYAKRATFEVKCEGCGVILLKTKLHDAVSGRTTHIVLAKQAMKVHVQETGCSGVAAPVEPEPNVSDAKG